MRLTPAVREREQQGDEAQSLSSLAHCAVFFGVKMGGSAGELDTGTVAFSALHQNGIRLVIPELAERSSRTSFAVSADGSSTWLAVLVKHRG